MTHGAFTNIIPFALCGPIRLSKHRGLHFTEAIIEFQEISDVPKLLRDKWQPFRSTHSSWWSELMMHICFGKAPNGTQRAKEFPTSFFCRRFPHAEVASLCIRGSYWENLGNSLKRPQEIWKSQPILCPLPWSTWVSLSFPNTQWCLPRLPTNHLYNNSED